MRKRKLKDVSEMNDTQKIIYYSLGIGENNATTRKDLVDLLGKPDPIVRKFIKSLMEYVPIVASFNGSGYFIPETVEELDGYVATLTSYVNGLNSDIFYLSQHRKNLVRNNEF